MSRILRSPRPCSPPRTHTEKPSAPAYAHRPNQPRHLRPRQQPRQHPKQGTPHAPRSNPAAAMAQLTALLGSPAARAPLRRCSHRPARHSWPAARVGNPPAPFFPGQERGQPSKDPQAIDRGTACKHRPPKRPTSAPIQPNPTRKRKRRHPEGWRPYPRTREGEGQLLRRRASPRPNKPAPMSAIEAGSGTPTGGATSYV